jgi:hypothetical protein
LVLPHQRIGRQGTGHRPPSPPQIEETMDHPTRRADHRRPLPGRSHRLAVLAFLLATSAAQLAAQSGPRLILVPSGGSRTLPAQLLGASVEPWFEQLIDDPTKVDIARQMGLAYVRFPGGTESNYYNWRTGLPAIEVFPNSSLYTRYWGQLIPLIERTFPNGFSMADYRPFADAIGAETLLVPNLETSSQSEQAAWFEEMRNAGQLTHHLEMGNEFYIAMADDPNVLAKWPDEPTAIAVTRQYLRALRPFLLAGTKVAVQSAGSAFYVAANTSDPFLQHQLAWDQALVGAPWFQAVTVHLYPDPSSVVGVHLSGPPTDATSAAAIFAAMMARADQGVDRVLTDIERRAPGKEIWVSEWNPRGPNPDGRHDAITPPMATQLVTRMTLAYLRHPSVTASLYFMLSFDPSIPFALYLPDGAGGYLPTPMAVVLRWLNEAANGGASYQAYEERKAPLLPGGGSWVESYQAVAGALFQKPGGSTLLLQNASAQARQWRPGAVGLGSPRSIETLSLPDLTDTTRVAPPVQSVTVARFIELPPYSVTRVSW